MGSKVGIRELKNRAIQIIREVETQRKEVMVTRDDELVVKIVPLQKESTKARRKRVQALLAEVEEFAQEVAAKWQGELNSVDAVAEQRRG